MFARLKSDVKAVFDRDPAARSVLEVVFCYPGLHAIWFHRLSHWLWSKELLVLPAAFLAPGTLPDRDRDPPGRHHRKGFLHRPRHGRRHRRDCRDRGECHPLPRGDPGRGKLGEGEAPPHAEDNVVVGSGAKVLGPFTVGKGSKVGSNSVVVKEVPANSTVVGIPGRVVMSTEKPQERMDLEHGKMPDPEAKAISCLFDQIRELERKYTALAAEHEELKKLLPQPQEASGQAAPRQVAATTLQ